MKEAQKKLKPVEKIAVIIFLLALANAVMAAVTYYR